MSLGGKLQAAQGLGGQTLRHHEGHRRVVLAECQQQLGVRRLQAPTEGAVIHRHQFFLDRADHLAHAHTRQFQHNFIDFMQHNYLGKVALPKGAAG